MAILNIRNLPDDVHRRLRLRAARAGHSMEAEARAILAEACRDPDGVAPPESLIDLVRELYGDQRPTGVVDALIAERRAEAAREDAES